jgi:hypothetical protein
MHQHRSDDSEPPSSSTFRCSRSQPPRRSWRSMRHTLLLLAAPCIAYASAGMAQQPSTPPTANTPCSYVECALGIAPSLISLDVVQGSRSRPVGRLGFFWPTDVRPIFSSSDSALAYAGRAVRTRRMAAALTDTGILLLGAAATIAASKREITSAGGGVGVAGAMLLAISYPVQLRADAHLSKAVWWYNFRFSR